MSDIVGWVVRRLLHTMAVSITRTADVCQCELPRDMSCAWLMHARANTQHLRSQLFIGGVPTEMREFASLPYPMIDRSPTFISPIHRIANTGINYTSHVAAHVGTLLPHLEPHIKNNPTRLRRLMHCTH